jgi:hypothetical protein
VLVGVIVALVAAAALGGCRAGPSSDPNGMAGRPEAASSPPASAVVPGPELAHGLLVLSGRLGAMRLALVDGLGATRPLPTPDPMIVWISAARDGRLLATTVDGRAYLSDPVQADRQPTWHRFVPTGFDAARLDGPLAFGTLAPDGRRAAFVAGDFAGPPPFELVLVDTATAAGAPTRIRLPADGAPPSWVGDRIVLLTRERDDEVGATVVDLATGTIAQGPGPLNAPRPAGFTGWIDPIAGLSIAADGSAVALVSGQDRRIEVDAAGPWLARADTSPEVVTPGPEADGSNWVAGLALSPAGDRLAIIRTDRDGDPVAVTIHERSVGWRQARRIPLPVGADLAFAAWLP